MFFDLIEFPIESKRLHWNARLVVRDINGVPHLFLRIKISGTSFSLRAAVPFVSVGRLRSRFVSISDDGLSANAYFESMPQNGDRVVFGYDESIFLRFPVPFESEKVLLLDPKRLSKNIRFIDRFFGSDN